MNRSQQVANALFVVGLAACSGHSSTTPSAKANPLALALVASVHFEGAQRVNGVLPRADASLGRVTLEPRDSAVAIAPGTTSLMALDVSDPDQASDSFGSTLMQFSNADSYVKLPSSKLGAAVASPGQTQRLTLMDRYTVDDDLCKNLCDELYATQIDVTVLVNGKPSQHRSYDVAVNCTGKGDPKKCSASDKHGGAVDGGAGRDAGLDASGLQAGTGAGMDAGARSDAASPSTSGSGGTSATGGTGATGSGGVGGDASGADLDAGSEDAATASPCSVSGSSHVVMQFDAVNATRVTNLQWIDSTGMMSANLVANSAGTGCPGATEYFGQAYGAPEGSAIAGGIGAGQKASLTQCGLETTVTLDATDCNGNAQDAITTKFTLYTDARRNEVRIERTWPFNASTPVNAGTGLRPFVPRVPAGTFTTVIYPNQAASAVTSGSVGSCGGDCITTTGSSWNGSWIADIAPSNGYAMIVLRDPAMTSPVDFTVNNDGASGSNLSSFVLVQPTSGWKAPITEVEYLCFEDLTTWPQSARDAAQLPAGCGP